jgi:hypothetical protein
MQKAFLHSAYHKAIAKDAAVLPQFLTVPQFQTHAEHHQHSYRSITLRTQK